MPFCRALLHAHNCIYCHEVAGGHSILVSNLCATKPWKGPHLTKAVCLRQDLAGRHVFKVEPLNAILDPQYFVRAVHGCVMAVLRDRSHAPRNAAENAGAMCACHQGLELGLGFTRTVRVQPGATEHRCRERWHHVRLTRAAEHVKADWLLQAG